MLTIDLPEDIDLRLGSLAKAAGRSKASYALDVLREHLDNLEDLRIAEERLAEIQAGRSIPVPIAELMRKQAIGDKGRSF